MIALIFVGLAVPQVARAHSPVLDACTCDWCYFDAARPADSSAALTCDLRRNISPDPPPACVCSNPTGVMGSEVAWYDAEADAVGDGVPPDELLNDMANLATTWDDTNLYFVAGLYNDPDPNFVPSGQLAIDVGPGGNSQWQDIDEVLGDSGVGVSVGIEADYLIVFDFSDFVFAGGITIGTCPGGFAPCYGKLYEATTSPGSWTFLANLTVALDPGVAGGTGGPPGKIETAVPWSAFQCTGCPSFVPGDAFKFTYMNAAGTASPIPPFTPSGPIEDLVTEEVAGTYTTTPNSCTIGAGTTQCELADGSSDGYINVAGSNGSPAGEVPDGSDPTDNPLRVSREPNGDITLSWDPSCLATDTDYAVYEGELGSLTSRVPVLCSTGGATTATFTPSFPSCFYLIVPTNGESDGSAGTNSAGLERPLGAEDCGRPQVIGECPP